MVILSDELVCCERIHWRNALCILCRVLVDRRSISLFTVTC